MEISGPRIGLRAMQLETVLAHVSQQLITCGRVRKHLTVRPEVGAVCEKDACPDLCGGREVTCVPTATAWHNGRLCNGPSWRRAHATPANTHVGTRGHGALMNDRVCYAFRACAPLPTLRRSFAGPGFRVKNAQPGRQSPRNPASRPPAPSCRVRHRLRA